MVRKDVDGIIQLRLLVLFSIALGLFAIFASNVFAQNSIDDYVTMDGYYAIAEKRFVDGTFSYEHYLFVTDEQGDIVRYQLKFENASDEFFKMSGNQVTVMAHNDSYFNNNARLNSNSNVMDVESMTLNRQSAQKLSEASQAQRVVPATQSMVTLLSQYSGDASVPHTKVYYEGRMHNDADSLQAFFADASYNQFSLSGTVHGWTGISGTQSSYDFAGSGFFDDFSAAEDAISAHDTADGIDFTQVDVIQFVFNDVMLDPCNCLFAFAYLDKIPLSTPDGNLMFFAAFYPDIFPSASFPMDIGFENGVGVPAHELGHGIGGWDHHVVPPPSISPYDSERSFMSGGDAAGPPGVPSWHRNDAGWMASSDIVTVSDGQDVTLTLDLLNFPSTGNPLMVIVPFGIHGEHYIVELRKTTTFDQTPTPNRFEVTIDHFKPGGHGSSFSEPNSPLARVDPNTADGDLDSPLALGASFADNGITVVHQSQVFGTSATLRVTNNVVGCSPLGSDDWIITSSCTLSKSSTAPANVIVRNNSVLTIPSGLTLNIDFVNNFLKIKSGSGVLIESGGTIKSLPVGMGDLIINEVMIDPALPVSDSSGEWVELYNPTSFPINLQGAVLSDDGVDSHTITSSVIVPSNGFVVLGIDGNFGTNGGVVVDYQYSSFFLGNSGDEVVITFQGTEIDRVDY
ncbi:MAG: lamin tail domain-containing protein, partial [Thaumarchaeota archaeon]|nr:lamin tail domain-containing protein [Nitrososphaerota archaeon]